MKNKLERFEKLCIELSNLVTELGKEDIEMLYHLNSDKLELTDGTTTFVEVNAPLMTLWD